MKKLFLISSAALAGVAALIVANIQPAVPTRTIAWSNNYVTNTEVTVVYGSTNLNQWRGIATTTAGYLVVPMTNRCFFFMVQNSNTSDGTTSAFGTTSQ